MGLAMALCCFSSAAADRPNVLFIAIDDLRNQLGHLGAAHMFTPNLDRLAASGRSFSHHFTHVPTCGASRASLLRGRYPDAPDYLGNDAIKRTHAGWADNSLPGWFKRHGYQTLALGKITHYPGGRTGRLWAAGPEELPGVWDRTWIPETPWGEPQNIMHGYANGQPRTPGKSPPMENVEGPDTTYPDAWVAAEAMATLKTLKASGAPWLFAVGFFKPHLPFAAPKKWLDLYANVDFPDPPNAAKPDGVSSWHGSGEFRGNYGHHGRDPKDDPEYALQLRRSYAAAISYTDHQIGRVLDELKRLGLEENTIVVAWSDHGFLLGEHAIWGKHCLYENALKSPLIVSYPGMKKRGEASDAIVQTVDIYPTLTDLCELPRPEGLDGRSLRPQLEDPGAPGNRPALGFWTRNQRTIRTGDWRLIVHQNNDGQVVATELLDFRTDAFFGTNVGDQFPTVVEALTEDLKQRTDF